MKKLLFLGCFFYLIILLIDASYILNCLSVLLFIVLLLYFMKNRKDFFVMSLFFSYGYFSTALVCLIAEPGSYFTEIQEFSFLTGATARNTLLCFFTLWGAAISFEWMYKSNLRFSKFSYRTDKFEMFATTSIYCLSILSLYYIYLTYGSPNDYGYDRFDYWSKVAPSWGGWMKSISEIWMLLLGRQFAITKRNRWIFLFLVGVISFYLVGDKFTSFVNSIIFFFMPILLISDRKLSSYISIKNILIFVVIISIILGVIFLSYYSIYNDIEKAQTLVYTRLTLQAQMWWSIDNISSLSPKSLNDIYEHFLGLTASDPRDNGIYYLMRLVTPSSLFYAMLNNGVTFTMAYPVNLIYFFGVLWAPIISCILGIWLGFF